MTREEIISTLQDDKTMPFIQPDQLANIVDFVNKNYKPSLLEGLEEAAEEYRRESYRKSVLPNIDGPMPEYGGSIKDAFIAGAEWGAEQVKSND